MESLQDNEAALIPPVTDFSDGTTQSPTPPPYPTSTPSHEHIQVKHTPKTPNHSQTLAYISRRTPKATYSPLDAQLLVEIETETEWSGPFLKKIRNALQVSLEEMAETTKVSKNYVLAIEEENYTKLPAAVYVRGFVVQIARLLRLPPEKVANGYLVRYNRPRSG